MRKFIVIILSLLAFICGMTAVFLPMQEGIHYAVTVNVGSIVTTLSEGGYTGWAYIFGQASSESSSSISQCFPLFMAFVCMCIGVTMSLMGMLFSHKGTGKIVLALGFAAFLEAGVLYLDAKNLIPLVDGEVTFGGAKATMTYTLTNGFLYSGVLALVSAVLSILGASLAGKKGI